MFYKRSCIIVFIVLIFFVSESKAQVKGSQYIPTLTYSELMQDKELYLGETVRVKAIHIYGFEWSLLCDIFCAKNKHETWVEFINEDNLCKGSKKKMKKGSDNFDNRAEVIYVGKLSRGNFGDGSYSYQFQVICVEKFKRLKVELK